MTSDLTAEAIVAVLDVHRVHWGSETIPFTIYGYCDCGWKSGAESHPVTTDPDAGERTIIRLAMFNHVASAILTEGVVTTNNKTGA
jgi:hypothetical protein